MAQIDLERREDGKSWGWLIGLVVLALLGWGLWSMADDEGGFADDSADDAGMIYAEEGENPSERNVRDVRSGTASSPTLDSVMEVPSRFIGRTLPDGEVDVASVPTDRGFWIERNGERLFALIIDVPQEEPKDINPGARLSLSDGTLRGPQDLSELRGRPLDADTEQIALAQEAFLVIDERYIEIVRPAGG